MLQEAQPLEPVIIQKIAIFNRILSGVATYGWTDFRTRCSFVQNFQLQADLTVGNRNNRSGFRGTVRFEGSVKPLLVINLV